ncbi:MAG: Hpt domain-containing protein [Hyphomicrobiales bacterium]|nr:Hpt domain-containing protein [Hyphomicrobiales bacterium]
MTAAAMRTVEKRDFGGFGRGPAPIDLVHLARQTFGSNDLEREVLGLFAAQTRILVEHIAAATPVDRGPLVHRLKGSARGVGATRVAALAEALEAPQLAESEARRLVDELIVAEGEARAFIEAIR